MPSIPKVPTPGAPVSIRWGRDVVDYLRDLDRRLRAVRPVQAGRKGGDLAPTPWEVTVYNKRTEADPEWKLRVRPGTINSLLPGNIFDEQDLGTGTKYVWLKVDTNGKLPTAAQILVDGLADHGEARELESMAPPVFYYLLAVVLDRVPFQLARNLLIATPYIVGFESREPETPGEEAFTRIYTWRITGLF